MSRRPHGRRRGHVTTHQHRVRNTCMQAGVRAKPLPALHNRSLLLGQECRFMWKPWFPFSSRFIVSTIFSCPPYGQARDLKALAFASGGLSEGSELLSRVAGFWGLAGAFWKGPNSLANSASRGWRLRSAPHSHTHTSHHPSIRVSMH